MFEISTHRAKRYLTSKQLATSSEDGKDDCAKREDFTSDWTEEDEAGVTHAVDFFRLYQQTKHEDVTGTRKGPLPSGCLSLNSIRIQAVKSPKAPRKTMRTMPGTMPTTASDEGRESIPLLTISAIMRAETSSHDRVLYMIFEGKGRISQQLGIERRKDDFRIQTLTMRGDKSIWNDKHHAPPHGQRHHGHHRPLFHSACRHVPKKARRWNSFPTCSAVVEREASRRMLEIYMYMVVVVFPSF